MADEQNSNDNSKTLSEFNSVFKRFRQAFKFDKGGIGYDITLKPDEKIVFSAGREKYVGIGGKDYAVVVTDTNHNGGIDGNDKIVVVKGQDAFVSSLKDFIRLCKEASGADVNKDEKIDGKDVDIVLQDPQKMKAIMGALGGDFQLVQDVKQASRLVSDVRQGGEHMGQLSSQLVELARQSSQKSTERA